MKPLPTEAELRSWANQAANAKTDIEKRLALMVLLQRSLSLLTALEMVLPQSEEVQP